MKWSDSVRNVMYQSCISRLLQNFKNYSCIEPTGNCTASAKKFGFRTNNEKDGDTKWTSRADLIGEKNRPTVNQQTALL